METEVWVFLAFSLGVSFYLAFNIGANDLANAMGTSVGSKALTVRQAVIWAALLNLAGAVLVGSRVTETVRKDIIDLDAIGGGGTTLSWTILFGMLAAMISAALWITIATYFNLPVSTTHAIVGAMMGFGLAAGGIAVVNWPIMGKIALSWVVSPLAGAATAFFCFWLMKRVILTHERPFAQTLRYAPWLMGLVFGILAIAMVIEGLENLHLGFGVLQILLIGVIVGVAAALPSRWLFKKYEKVEGDEYQKVERIFIPLQICTAGYVAFAHGSNDVANAIGPVSGIVGQLAFGSPEEITRVAIIGLLLLGGLGIAIGTAVWGRGVMKTIGERITDITPTRGFTAEFAAATTVLVCSMMGLPISTTHVLVGAVIGVGIAGGVAAVDANVIKNIVMSWLVTVPVAAGLCVLIFLGMSYIA
jgi:PiT family inorganic phosphate transporter